MIRLGIISSSAFAISRSTRKGTEIFLDYFLSALAQYPDITHHLDVTVFASKNSIVPFPLIHLGKDATWGNPEYTLEDHKLFEQALITKAFSMQDTFDLYHVHLGDGSTVMPYIPFLKKPVVITLHSGTSSQVRNYFFSQFDSYTQAHFVAISQNQQKLEPLHQYVRVIPHGIQLDHYVFNEAGAEKIIWAGRAVPEKGLDTALIAISSTHKEGKVFPILKPEGIDWFQNHVMKLKDELFTENELEMNLDLTRTQLAKQLPHAKLLLFPISWEEPFGLILVEAMATGTPVVAYARGATPEIVVDGVTGFLVNPSEQEKRGNYVIKTTGIAGLIEAIERVYSLSSDEYRDMRKACRERIEKNFTAERMIRDYLQVYQQLVTGS